MSQILTDIINLAKARILYTNVQLSNAAAIGDIARVTQLEKELSEAIAILNKLEGTS